MSELTKAELETLESTMAWAFSGHGRKRMVALLALLADAMLAEEGLRIEKKMRP